MMNRFSIALPPLYLPARQWLSLSSGSSLSRSLHHRSAARLESSKPSSNSKGCSSMNFYMFCDMSSILPSSASFLTRQLISSRPMRPHRPGIRHTHHRNHHTHPRSRHSMLQYHDRRDRKMVCQSRWNFCFLTGNCCSYWNC